MKKQISSELKGKIALEAIRSLRSVNDIASEYGVYPAQVGQLKKRYIAASVIVFESSLMSYLLMVPKHFPFRLLFCW